MDYKLALELKNAGFPQDREASDDRYIIGKNLETPGGVRSEVIYIPTLSELIEACGDNLSYMRRVVIRTGETQIQDGWEVCQAVDKDQAAILIQEFELDEAVARLWLALNK